MSMNWDMYDDILKECKKLGIAKNKDYGSESLKLFDGVAIVCRMNDKVQRINNIFESKQMTGVSKLNNKFEESIDDTLMDLINYTTYLLMLRKGGIQ